MTHSQWMFNHWVASKQLLANILDVHPDLIGHDESQLVTSKVAPVADRRQRFFLCCSTLKVRTLSLNTGKVCLQLDVYKGATTKAKITSPPFCYCEPCVAHPHRALTLNSNTKGNMVSQSTCAQFFLFP